jgi:hypothetical protein
MEYKHSGLGIASTIISVVAAIGMFAMVVVAGVMEATTPGGIKEDEAAAVIVGLLIIGAGMAELAALGLGIAGAFQSDRNKLFPILGIVFSCLTILGVIALMIIGVMAG